MANDHLPLHPPIETPTEVPPLVRRSPIDVRSTSLVVLAVLGVIGLLFVAQAVFIPVAIAVLANYALTPVVVWLKRRARLPTAMGAALVLAIVLAGLGAGVSSLQPRAMQILDIVPRATVKFRQTLRRAAHEPPGAVAKLQKATDEIARAAAAASATGPIQSRSPTAMPPRDATPAFQVRDYLMMGTASAIAGMGQLIVVLSLVYFLLIAGDNFRRTLMRVSGDTLSQKKITLQILDEIDSQIQRYLLVQLATSALLGVVAWGVFAWIGLDNALFWGCMGGVLHLIPYVGPAVFMALVTLIAYVQFDNLQPVLLVTGSALASVAVIGLLLVPLLTQRVGRLNAVTVFIALLFWGWLWGVWGLLLGVPIVMALHAVCERVEDLQPISEFLGVAREKK